MGVLRRALVVAGEASGDMHAANLVREIAALRPGVSFFGIGGERMRAAGVEVLVPLEELSVVGFTEVLSKVGAIKRAMSILYREAARRKPDIALLVDYPGFNLRFAKLVKHLIPRIIYYIGPQVWAWGSWRASSIPRLFDALISVIPFECEMYRGTGLRCFFVGHPVMDLARPSLDAREFRAKYDIGDEFLVGIVPGSRREEVKRILPVMLNSARVMNGRMSGVAFAVSAAETVDHRLVRMLCDRFYGTVPIVRGGAYDLMHASDILMVASGTATLEAAVLGKPMSIVYKTSPLTWALARGLVKVRSVGLVNIIAGREVVPEFIQYSATPGRIAGELLSLAKDEARLALMRQDLELVKERLGDPGAGERAARVVVDVSGPA